MRSGQEYRPIFRAARPRRRSPLSATAGLLVCSTLLLGGCSHHDTLQAESRELALTSGPGVKVGPRCSPDGRFVAYTKVEEMDRAAVYIVPTQGGNSRRVSADGSERVYDWTPDGRGLFVWNFSNRELRAVSLNGDSLSTIPKVEMSWIQGVSRDGSRFLWRKFTGDNLDLALSTRDGTDQILAETPEWESEACFGPGPGQVTAARQSTYKAPHSELAIWSPDTREYTALPIPKARNLAPAWSPDHRYLAYVSDQEGNLDLWVYDSRSRTTVRLTNTREEENQPDWSADGQWIVFSRRMQTAHIFVGNPETYEKRQITSGESKDTGPVPSPDGHFVVFVRRSPVEGGGMSNPSLCVVSADGGEVRRLDLDGLVPDQGEGRVTWSPDGTQLAFSADDGTGNVDLYRIALDGGRPERVTIRPGNDVAPMWSPDGRYFAYMRLADGQTQICVIPVRGGIAKRVTSGVNPKQAPAWAPDSDHIAYSNTDLDTEATEVWVTSYTDTASAHFVAPPDPEEEGNYPGYWTQDGRDIIVWRMAADQWTVHAVSADGTHPSVRVAEMGHGDAEHFLKFTPEGKQYLKTVFPEGIHTFATGDDVSNIFALRVPSLIETKLRAEGDWN